MILFTGKITSATIWMVLLCLYCNGIVGAFAHILNPAIQADIRDYQQYRISERIDGMFAAVATIGSVITLITSSVIPTLQEKLGMNVETARRVVNDSALMARKLPGKAETIGQILHDQAANGQDIFNASNALYDVDGVLIPLLRVLIIVAAIGATLNVIPFFFYDFTEKKQKAVVRVLKVRALFEDYANDALSDKGLVEAVDLVNNAKWQQLLLSRCLRRIISTLRARKRKPLKRLTVRQLNIMRKSKSHNSFALSLISSILKM